MRKHIFIVLITMCLCLTASAHVIPYELDKVKEEDGVFWKYLFTGFKHIIPLGFDHILFILCVFFLNTNIKQIVLQASMFTLAHSITLGLTAYGIISPSPDIVEPIIALSIVMLAIENIFSVKVRPWRMALIFLFGLVHGMGFAGALGDLGLPNKAFGEALISFNIGVEIGQLVIILFMYLVVGRIFAKKEWYRSRILIPSSLAIASIAMYWTVERTFF